MLHEPIEADDARQQLGRDADLVTVIGPRQKRIDVSLSKLTRLTEETSLEIRIEAYNITNTPSFRNPDSDLGSGGFGEITETPGGPRVIQLGPSSGSDRAAQGGTAGRTSPCCPA